MGPFSLGELSQEPVRSQLRKIIESRAFRRAGRLRALLEYLIEEALSNPGAPLKEYHIATAALGRPATFDPQQDSIVRVQARRLRTKLREYYRAEGAADPILIELPLGRYIPEVTTHVAGPSTGTYGDGAKAIAILPFKALGNAADTQLAQALIEELACAMMEQRKIRLLAWHSDALPADRRRVAVVGQQINLGAILEGSVYTSGDSVRVSVQLIRVPDGWLLWSQIYRRQGALKIELQRELAVAIVQDMTLPPEFTSNGSAAVAAV